MATASTKEVQLNALIWSSKHPPCKMQANRYDGSRPTVREQDHLKTPPSLLHVEYMYLRGFCVRMHPGVGPKVTWGGQRQLCGHSDVLNFLGPRAPPQRDVTSLGWQAGSHKLRP
jgi:hypothetical protein